MMRIDREWISEKGVRTESPYPPFNNNIINVLPSQAAVHESNALASKSLIDPKAMSPLEIPGPRDLAVKEYGEWQISNVANDSLKTAFRQVCDVMLDHGLDLEQVYQDQDPNFFIEKGIKIGITRRFVEDIGKWTGKSRK